MPKSKTTETDTNVVALTEHLDKFRIDEFLSIPMHELRAKCSFLVKTSKPELGVGITFVLPDNEAGLHLEVAAVRTDFRGSNRVPLSMLATEYDVLAIYATAGKVSKQFTQRLINWGEFKTAISELAGDVVEAE